MGAVIGFNAAILGIWFLTFTFWEKGGQPNRSSIILGDVHIPFRKFIRVPYYPLWMADRLSEYLFKNAIYRMERHPERPESFACYWFTRNTGAANISVLN